RARGAMLRLSGELRSRTARRPPRSLKQEYQEFLLQRIEEYKNALTRENLLVIGDEAVRELEESAAGQYLLTEVLLLEHVDRIIARRLRLPSFPRWRQQHRRLRAAQRAPVHWGLEAGGPLAGRARERVEGLLAGAPRASARARRARGPGGEPGSPPRSAGAPERIRRMAGHPQAWRHSRSGLHRRQVGASGGHGGARVGVTTPPPAPHRHAR